MRTPIRFLQNKRDKMRASIATPSEEPVETMETPQVIIEPTVIPIVQKVVYESKPKKDKHK